MTSPQDELTMKADRLARSAAPVWEEFIKAFSDYATKRVSECVAAPGDKVVVAQGRAQECTRLLELFINAKTDAAKLQQRNKL